VNDSDKTDIANSVLQGVRGEIAALPAVLAASQTFRAAATSAAKEGACQSSRPGNCPGGVKDQLDKASSDIINTVGAGTSLANNQLLQGINNTVNGIATTVNTVNTKLGAQITGGLSAWTGAIAEVVNRSQVLNILTYISTLHNAYFLSNALTQTLFSAVSNILTGLGIKDTSKDPAGTPIDVGQVVGQWTEGFAKLIIGAETVNGIKSDWKKYSRIYQAAANVIYSLQSISNSILGALEVVGSHVAKIGNALQRFRSVGEKAYSWMNPQPFFQNRFTNGLQQAQEIVSGIDQAASSIVSAQESLNQLNTQTEELKKSIGEDPAGKKAGAQPEAAQVKAAEDAAKIASKSPDIPESARVKP
jgi:hypothetical protein